MPFEVKVRPVDFFNPGRDEPVKTPARSRFKRIFMRGSSPEKVVSEKKDENDDFEPGSVCLARMVRNFMEESPEKVRCGRNWCNCVNGECMDMDGSDDEFESCSCFGDLNLSSSGEACENVKSLVPCASVAERNLLADTARIVDQNMMSKRKDDVFLKIVADGLSALGYTASICNSRWEKSSACPAGEYKYVDVVTEGERLIIDIDFRAEFEIARPTKKYRTILQALPAIFVGKSDRLQRIISIVTDAAKQSLKKKGMPFPPWRKVEYVKAKWFSAYCRTISTGNKAQELLNPVNNNSSDKKLEDLLLNSEKHYDLEPQLTFGETSSPIVLDGRVIGGGLLTNNFEKNETTLVEAQIEQNNKNLQGVLMISEKCSDLKPRLTFGEKGSPIVLEEGRVEDSCSETNNFVKNEKALVEAQIEQQKITILKKSSGIKITGGLACIIEDEP